MYIKHKYLNRIIKIIDMKNLVYLIATAVLISLAHNLEAGNKLVSSKTHIKFFSTTPVEDIEANNYTSTSTIDTETGDVIFSVPMQGFEFEKALMQKHFNNADFLDTKAHPRARLSAKISNFGTIDFSKDGTYPADVSGEMTIQGKSKTISEKGTITVKGSVIDVQSKFNLTLADFGINFVKGKPSSNIAKTVEVTVHAQYQPE